MKITACKFPGCLNTRKKNKQISFYKFPTARFKNWCDILNLDYENVAPGSFLCGNHFGNDQFVNNKRITLNKSAVPSLTIRFDKEIVPFQHPVPSKFVPILPKPTPKSPEQQVGPTQNGGTVSPPSKDVSTPVLPTSPPSSSASSPTNSLDASFNRKKVRQIQQRLRRAKAKIRPVNIECHLNEVFGDKPSSLKDIIKSQWDRLLSKRRTNYKESEKVTAMTIYYSTTKRGYRTLQKLGLQLPSISTINRWHRKLNISPGINAAVSEILHDRISEFNEKEKDCVLMLDEMAIKKYLLYNKHKDIIEGVQDHGLSRRKMVPATEALVFMVRGLNTNWCLSYSFYFSADSTTSDDLRRLLFENMDSLLKLGLKIRVVVSDQSFTNQGLYGILGVSIEKPYIIRDNQKIYFAYDSPHIIKNIRNHLKKHGYCIEGKPVLWEYVEEFYAKDSSSEQRLAPKLSRLHIEIPDLSKMKVKLATQLFSHSVAAGMLTLLNLPEDNDRKMNDEAKATAEFIKEMDTIFDMLNTSQRHVIGKRYKSANNYAYDFITKLRSSRAWVSNWMMADGTRIVDSVKALQLTLHSVELLLVDLNEDGYGYVFTRRIQQDMLEHYFANQRGRHGFCTNPTTKQFMESFKYLLICNAIGSSTGSNCESLGTTNLITRNTIRLRKLLQVGRLGVSQPAGNIVPAVSMPPCSDSSDNEFESSDDEEDNNDLDITHNESFDFFELKDLHEIDIKDDNVTVYMANWCIKSQIKRNMKDKKQANCVECKKLIEVLENRQSHELDDNEQLVKHKAYFGDFDDLLEHETQTFYGHLVVHEAKEVFLQINRAFRQAIINYFNPKGERVLCNILLWVKRKEYIRKWLIDKESCRKHREEMVKLFLRAKIYQIVKHKNMLHYRQPKSFSQTRRDLRHQ